MSLCQPISKSGISGRGPTLKVLFSASASPKRGRSTPTFTRTTAGTVLDFEGILHTANINELRFPEQRRVENLLSVTEVAVNSTVTVVSGSSYIYSFAGTGNVTFSGAATGSIVGTGSGRDKGTITATSTSLTITVSGSVLQAQLVLKSGTQTDDQDDDYVSKGVLSWPYHGCGVDGVKYFNTDREGNTLEFKGALIEPPATNLFLCSTSPVTRNVTVVSGSKYVIWGEGSGSIVLSGAGSGTVTENSPVTITATSTSLVCTVSNMTFVQVELNVKTSHIITTSAPVSRTADVLYYSVSNLTTQGKGSLYCEFVYNGAIPDFAYVLYLSDGTANNRILVHLGTGTSTIRLANVCSGVVNADISKTGLVKYTTYKVMATYINNSLKFYVNGALSGTDTLGSVSTSLTKLNIGSTHLNNSQLNGLIKDVKYFKEVLSEKECIRMTA